MPGDAGGQGFVDLLEGVYQFILDDWSNYKGALAHMGSALSKRVIQTMNRFRYQQLERPQIKTFTVFFNGEIVTRWEGDYFAEQDAQLAAEMAKFGNLPRSGKKRQSQ